jgi:hypothetical protein
VYTLEKFIDNEGSIIQKALTHSLNLNFRASGGYKSEVGGEFFFKIDIPTVDEIKTKGNLTKR